MHDHADLAGMAALSICEALLLAMSDHAVLPQQEIVGVLRDAAATHENTDGPDVETHKAVAAIINQIIASGNSVRRT